ncbi:MarR family transcriptional regulator [Pseudoalteromonas prydzensis]|uniref:MarR family transcriptional regulator n=1 Tax=Pseudoalteromonas prydzensis TaxID=182141 RepID=UPI0007E4F0A3|nr:MarR family transcriptional regulator [Pseudoalteromonas prydzensis]MBE0379828.1 MarR family transcriptional regulator, transcriptional regulator for hemolysin [Pseudoalteromonas prydzensis ACAM 620]
MTSPIPFHETLDLTLCGNMGRVHRLCREAITAAVEPLGLTQSRWIAMIHINHLSEGATQQQLAHSLGIEMPSLTRTVKQLEQQQLITRRVDEDDKRSRKIYFTEQGQQLLSTLKVLIVDVKLQLYAGLTTAQLDTMAYGLVQMEENARRCLTLLSQEK